MGRPFFIFACRRVLLEHDLDAAVLRLAHAIAGHELMSALPPTADIVPHPNDVRCGSLGDIREFGPTTDGRIGPKRHTNDIFWLCCPATALTGTGNSFDRNAGKAGR
jgi:hypothetical protein